MGYSTMPTEASARASRPRSTFRKSKKGSTRKSRVSPDRAQTSAAIRRGSVKISGPFPIQKNTEADDDFPLRNSTAVFSITEAPAGQKDLSAKQKPEGTGGASIDTVIEADAAAEADAEGGGDIGRAFTTVNQPVPLRPARRRSPNRASVRVVSFNDDTTTLQGSTVRASTLDNRKSMASASSVVSTEQTAKKTGPLKTAIKRLFSRKTKKDRPQPKAQLDGSSPQSDKAPELHRSDPGALAATVDGMFPNSSRIRVTSAPFGEITKATPLGSYAPSVTGTRFKEDLEGVHRLSNGPAELECQEGQDKEPEQTGQGRARRASLPSVTFTGLAPRPCASQGKGEDDVHLGAYLGDGQPENRISHIRRRSRSAGDLRASDDVHRWEESSELPVSDDVKDLRQSVSEHLATPLSTLSPSRKAEETKEELTVSQLKSDSLRVSNRESNALTFSPLFENLETMKITEAAALETRVVALECKTATLETAVEELQNAPKLTCSRSTEFVLEDAPKRRSFRDRSSSSKAKLGPPSPTSSISVSHKRSFERTSQYNNVPITPREDKAPRGSTPPPRGPSPTPAMTPTRSSAPVLGGPQGLTSEHYSTLLALLKHEQSARRRLERHLSSLQQDLAVLKTPTAAVRNNSTAYNSTAYPTPSPDQSDHDGHSPRTGRSREKAVAPTSYPDSVSDCTTDDGYTASDVFETPIESTAGHHLGQSMWDDEEDEEELPKGRGMSLSQLTHPASMAAFKF